MSITIGTVISFFELLRIFLYGVAAPLSFVLAIILYNQRRYTAAAFYGSFSLAILVQQYAVIQRRAGLEYEPITAGNTIFWAMVVASLAIMVGNEVAPVFMRNCNETVNRMVGQFVRGSEGE